MKPAFLNVNGLKIRYLEAGNSVTSEVNSDFVNPRMQKHVLFIHGLGSSADRWLDIPDALSLVGMHSIAIDLPGFGLSDKPPDMGYTIGDFVKVTTEFMLQAGIAKQDGSTKTSIVGHSLGGYIGAQLASEHPELVDKLVLIDSSGMLRGPTPLLQQYLDAAMNPSKQSVRSVFEQMVADRIRIPEALVDGFIYRIGQPGALHAFKMAFENSVNTQIGPDSLKQIDVNNIPTLIIWGRKDNLIPLEHSKIFRKAIQRSRLEIIEDAGHAPIAEKPAIVSELLHQFYRQV